MALSDIVSISISTSGAQIEREGFGIPLVLTAEAPIGFTERVRFYTDLTGLAIDFAAGTATYKEVSALFAQNPKPPKVAVGRLANKPTQKFKLTPTAVNNATYQVAINGTTVQYLADGTATVAEITAGLKLAIDALGAAVTTTDNTTDLDVTANSAGAFFSLQVFDISKLAVAQTHADPGVATDLDAIKLEDNTWYGVLNPFNSKAMALAIAGWVESNKKLFLCQTQDSNNATLSTGSDASTSLMAALKADSYFRTAAIYHPQTDAFAGAAWAGAGLPLDPGSETWAFKTLAGVPVTTLTSTQRTNILAKNGNTYEMVAGLNVTYEGKTAGGEYIDVIRFRDWLEARMSEDVFAALAKAKKIPFTDDGIAVIEGILKANLKAGVDAGGLAADPAPVVIVPLAAAVSSADKSARKLTGVKFDATLAGAIHAVTVSGTVTV